MLLTRSPLNWEPKSPVAFDLHVLGTPPALILSQDQTLKFKFRLREPFDCLLFSNYLRCYFCLVSSLVTKEQLTLDGLVARFGFRDKPFSFFERVHALSSFQRTKDYLFAPRRRVIQSLGFRSGPF